MKRKATVASKLLPLEAIALGRLITNTHSPEEEFHDSSLLAESISGGIIVTVRNNFREVLRCTSGTSVHSNLTAMLSSHTGKESLDYVQLESLENKTYQLSNSTSIFEDLCQSPGTRRWLERMLQKGRDIYMIVGLETITNADVSYRNRIARERGGEVAAPVSAALAGAAGIPILLTDALDVGVGSTKSESSDFETKFLAPGEMVFAFQYRKLKISWWFSKDINKLSLRKSRWMINLGVRTLRKFNGEKTLNEGEPELEDVIDAQLESEASDEEDADGYLDVGVLGISLSV